MNRRSFIAALGGAMATPAPFLLRAATAEQKTWLIGYLHFATPDYEAAATEFLKGLADKGYEDGKNIRLEYRWAEGHYDRLPAMAADLVASKVDLIAAFGPPPAKAAKDATSTIPIVFEVGNDAVQAGLVTSLSRPEGNATGMNILFTQMTPKRLELLTELIPTAKNIALLINPKSPTAEPSIHGGQQGARARGVQLSILNASIDAEIDPAFAQCASSGADGLIVAADPFFDTRRKQLIAAAARHKVPTNYFEPEFSTAGGLISYGARLSTVYQQMGITAGRILDGERPADLPVEQPTRFELVINVKAARALGIVVSPRLLSIADEVIE